MNIVRIIYTAKFIGRALISGFHFNRIRKARNTSMDLGGGTTSNTPKTKADVSNNGVGYLDGERVVTLTDGRLLRIRDRT